MSSNFCDSQFRPNGGDSSSEISKKVILLQGSDISLSRPLTSNAPKNVKQAGAVVPKPLINSTRVSRLSNRFRISSNFQSFAFRNLIMGDNVQFRVIPFAERLTSSQTPHSSSVSNDVKQPNTNAPKPKDRTATGEELYFSRINHECRILGIAQSRLISRRGSSLS